MKNYLEILFRFWFVIGYYGFICPILYLILLICHPFSKSEVTYKNVFDSNFIDTDPEIISQLKIGEQYSSFKSAYDWLINKETIYTKK